MLTHCIGDGYTRTNCYLSEEPGIYAALDGFDYRPVIATHRQSYQFRINKAAERRDDCGAKQLVQIAHEVITKYVTNLTLVDQHGKPQPAIKDGVVTEIGKRLIELMEPTLMIRLQNVCLGFTPTDKRPDPAEGDKAIVNVDLDHLDSDQVPESHLEGELIAETTAAGN